MLSLDISKEGVKNRWSIAGAGNTELSTLLICIASYDHDYGVRDRF